VALRGEPQRASRASQQHTELVHPPEHVALDEVAHLFLGLFGDDGTECAIPGEQEPLGIPLVGDEPFTELGLKFEGRMRHHIVQGLRSEVGNHEGSANEGLYSEGGRGATS